MSQLKKGAMLSYVTIILTNGIGLVLTPFMIAHLGDSEYGLYTLIGSLIGYISVMDLGLNNTIVRFTAKYRALRDRPGEENFLATAMLIYGCISTILVLGGVAIYFNLDAIFDKLTPVELGKARIMFLILIFNLAVTLPGNAFQAICNAYEHFVFPRGLNIIRYLSRSVLVVAILLLHGDSVSVVILDTVVNLSVIALTGWYVFRKLRVKFRLHEWQKQLVRQIFGYSIWIFIFAMVGQFQWRAGQVIVGSISGSIPAGIYGVGIMLGTYYGAFSTAISGVFLPRATKMTVNEASGEELTTMMIRIGRYSFLTLLLIFGGFLLYGRQFILLWVGDHYDEAYIIALVIMFSYTMPLVQSFANSILEARSLFSFKALAYISLIGLGTVVGTWMYYSMGLTGLILGSTGGWLVSQIVMNVYFQKRIGLDIPRFFRELFRGMLPSFLAVLAVGWCINALPGAGWGNLLLKIFAFLCTFLVLMFRFGLNQGERETFLAFVPGFLRKRLNG